MDVHYGPARALEEFSMSVMAFSTACRELWCLGETALVLRYSGTGAVVGSRRSLWNTGLPFELGYAGGKFVPLIGRIEGWKG